MAARPTRSIACVYCGGTHTSAQEVRECWQRTDGNEAAITPDLDDPTFNAASTAPSTAATRGPVALGRNVLVAPGQAAPVEWADAPRLVVHLGDVDLLPALFAAAQARVGQVFEVSAQASPEGIEPGSTTAAPHTLGPRFTFADDTVRHLLLANSVDARHQLRWPLLAQALAAGAHPVADGRGDVELPGGERAWLDGGPPRHTPAIDGVRVLHRVSVEHGSLRLPAGNVAHAGELAPDQLAAVTHDGGAARIIAPAGSGKTRVLTERARHLVTQWGLPPSAVCLVAFNKRAQEEMAARTTDLRQLQVRTLNAIALAVVNGTAPFARRPQRVSTIDEPEVRRIIGRMVQFPRKRNADPVATWIEALSLARLGLRDPDEVEAVYDGDVGGFADMFPRYREHLARAGQVDYDEQVYRAIELLLADPDARATAQRACRLMLVDEFQDLTPAHLLLVRLLAGPDAAVFGVGDDDQTIYGYNGADPSWLIDFAQLFPGAGEHPLQVNYRCPGGIVRSADTLLRHNIRRVPKVIRSAKSELDGFRVADIGGDSVDTTVQAITAAVAAGTPPSHIAVLTRVNSLLAPVQVALRTAGVPTNGGVGREFVERTAVRAALAWLHLATGGQQFDPNDVAEALRRPSRPLHPRIAGWVGEQTSLAALRRLSARLTEQREVERVSAFADDLEAMQAVVANGGTTSRVLAILRDQMGLANSIASLDLHRRGMNRAAQNDDLVALGQLAALQPDPRLFESWLRAALDTRWADDGVVLATVHRVKGQEWPLVVVHHADADQFPHRLADDEEEERRLFHVAITRASGDVLVVPSEHPSPFILECSTEPPARRVPAQRTPPGRSATPATPSRADASKAGDGLTPEQAALFEELRSLRRHLAAGKPAYTVLPDTALHAIAVAHPSSLDELAAIRGVGPSKLAQYGAALLAAVEATDSR